MGTETEAATDTIETEADATQKPVDSVADATEESAASEAKEKGAEEKPAETKSLTDGEDSETSEAPAEYEAFDMSEGMEVDSGLLEALSPVLIARGMDQEGAQELVSAYSDYVSAQTTQALEAIETQRTEDLAAIEKDPVLGGKNFDDTKANINRVMQHAGMKELNGLMRTYGLDNNPIFVRALYGLGSQMKEGSFVGPGEKAVTANAAPEDGLFSKTKEE